MYEFDRRQKPNNHQHKMAYRNSRIQQQQQQQQQQYVKPAKTISTTVITFNNDEDFVSDGVEDSGNESDHDDRHDLTLDQQFLIHNQVNLANLLSITVTFTKLRTIISSQQTPDATKILDSDEESVQEFDSTIKSLINVLNRKNYQYNIPNHHFFNEFVIKFNVNFYSKTKPILGENNTTDRNSFFILNLFLNLLQNFGSENPDGIVIEFPFNSLNLLMEDASHDLIHQEYFASKISSLSIGSIINLSTFVKRLDSLVPKNNVYPELEIDFNKKLLALHFHVNQTNVLYRLEIGFSSIKFLLLDKGSKYTSQHNRFYLELNASPFLFIQTNVKGSSNRTRWDRIKDFKSSFQMIGVNVIDDCLTRQFDENLLGNALAYRIDIYSDHSINSLIYLGFVCKDMNRNFSFYIGRIQEAHFSLYTLPMVSKCIDQYFLENYAINYALRVLFFKSYKMIDSLVYKNYLEKFMEKVRSLSAINGTMLEDCLYSLDAQCKNRIIDPMVELDKIWEEKKALAAEANRKNLKELVVIRRAQLSPTKIEFCRPIALLRSRFSNIANLDYALRLTLIEDNNRQLNGITSDFDFIKNSIRPRLLNGIQIGDRLFQFLGSSSSQMRESGIIFYAQDDQSRTAQSIRDLVGNFDDFKRKVAKYIARFGLIFSQAIAYYEIGDRVKVFRIPDFKTKNDEFCFSDGIGIISTNVAEKIMPSLRLPKNYFPSAFQIRHGGCKGMLVSYPTKEDAIVFRESMIKFPSNDNNLGILKFSAPRSVYLNRPLINILNHQYVPAEVFYRIFNHTIKLITKALLFKQDSYNLMRIYRNRNIPYEKFFQSGISFLQEPFFRRILNYLVFYRLYELKTKARIPIPSSNGRMAFGVIDENRILDYGEIFFQYSEVDSDGIPTGNTFILEDQEVMVTKFPCLSLGDVRKFKAINVPELRHIKDCLVFPANGERPHTDEMGGSDLDGDEYAIFWQTGLIFPGENYKPMDFISQNSCELNHDILLDDIVAFYCDFLLENNIGQVANCHLMYSDFHPQGLRSQECDELASKYSISLDFQKNGVNSKLEKKYQPNCKWIRPDFMEKRGFTKSYLSQKILGQFYRHCCLVEAIIKMSDEFLIANEENSLHKPEPSLILKDWRLFETEAMEAFLEYNHKVIEIMETMDIESEVALLSDVYEDKSDVSPFMFDELFQHFRQKFEIQSRGKTEPERLLLTSAWYAICFEKCDLLQYQYQNQPLMGLPFMISNEIIKLWNFARIKQPSDSTETTTLPPEVSPETLAEATPCKTIPPKEDSGIEGKKIIEIAKRLIVFWMRKMNQIFKHRLKTLRIYKNQSWVIIKEKQLMEDLIMKKLRSIVEDNKEIYEPMLANDKKHIDSVLFLFNQFMFYLYELCETINNLINVDSGEIFLLRYSLFALNFINKINEKPSFLSHSFDSEQPVDLDVTQSSSNKNCGDEICKTRMSMAQIETRIKCYLESLLGNFFRNNSCQVKRSKFCMLNNHSVDPTQLDFKNLDEDFYQKIKFLVGAINDIRIFDQHDNCIYVTEKKSRKIVKRLVPTSTDTNNNSNFNNTGCNLSRLNLEFFTLNTCGYQVSNALLKLLIGHPKFNVDCYKNFHIL